MNNNSVFKFTNVDKTQCEFKEKKYDVTISEKTQEKYFINSEDRDKKYYIIENQEQVIARILKNDGQINLKKCIFVYNVQFLGPINKTIAFNDAVFCENVNFEHVTFKDSVWFLRSIFEKEVRICSCEFNDSVIFDDSVFKGEVSFFMTNVIKTFQATRIYSEKEFSFSMCKFYDNIQLNGSIFKESLAFHSEIVIEKNISFYRGTIKYLLFNDIKTGKDFSITLLFSKIEDLDYGKTDLKDIKNRETALLLKEFAIKKHDQINALKYYKKEMNAHIGVLSEKKNIDYRILGFEKIVSEFGTNPIRPFMIILFISGMLSLFLSFYLDCFSMFFENTILLINPTTSVQDVLKTTLNLNADIYIAPLIEVVNFVKNILFGVLIYEIIKSFRKFSRKL